MFIYIQIYESKSIHAPTLFIYIWFKTLLLPQTVQQKKHVAYLLWPGVVSSACCGNEGYYYTRILVNVFFSLSPSLFNSPLSPLTFSPHPQWSWAGFPLTPGVRGSVVAELSVIKAYKTGGLKLLQASRGHAMMMMNDVFLHLKFWLAILIIACKGVGMVWTPSQSDFL